MRMNFHGNSRFPFDVSMANTDSNMNKNTVLIFVMLSGLYFPVTSSHIFNTKFESIMCQRKHNLDYILQRQLIRLGEMASICRV